ncbi:MAG: alpha/beta hydrolase [Acidimicrobiales bacterium]
MTSPSFRSAPSSGVRLREWGEPGPPEILLWPGLGSTGAYFAPIAEELPGRAVAADPPGYGGSAPLEPSSFVHLVDVARVTAGDRRCKAMVGHSLGAYVALGVGCDPPEELRAIVLMDGGFLTARDFVAIGMPVLSGYSDLVAWMQSSELNFPNWETATRELARMLSADVTPAFEAYLREVMVEVNGEIREASSPERAAESVLAAANADVLALGSALKVPTLLVACGQPLSSRPVREKAWQDFAAASPLVELHVEDEWAHNPVLQFPQATARLIGDWLRAHL